MYKNRESLTEPKMSKTEKKLNFVARMSQTAFVGFLFLSFVTH